MSSANQNNPATVVQTNPETLSEFRENFKWNFLMVLGFKGTGRWWFRSFLANRHFRRIVKLLADLGKDIDEKDLNGYRLTYRAYLSADFLSPLLENPTNGQSRFVMDHFKRITSFHTSDSGPVVSWESVNELCEKLARNQDSVDEETWTALHTVSKEALLSPSQEGYKNKFSEIEAIVESLARQRISAYVDGLARVDISTIASGTRCSFCWRTYGFNPDPAAHDAESNIVRQMPCGHMMHQDCLIEILERSSDLCPHCATVLVLSPF